MSAEFATEIVDYQQIASESLVFGNRRFFSASEIYNIINYRINQSKPFIISTNLDWEELEKKYSKRVASRIIGSCSNLKFIGNDIRQIKSFN